MRRLTASSLLIRSWPTRGLSSYRAHPIASRFHRQTVALSSPSTRSFSPSSCLLLSARPSSSSEEERGTVEEPFFLQDDVEHSDLAMEADVLITQLQEYQPRSSSSPSSSSSSSGSSSRLPSARPPPVFVLSRCERLLEECLAAGAIKEAERLSVALLPIVQGRQDWGGASLGKVSQGKRKSGAAGQRARADPLMSRTLQQHEAVLLSLMLRSAEDTGNQLLLHQLLSIAQDLPSGVKLTSNGASIVVRVLLQEQRPRDALNFLRKVFLTAPIDEEEELPIAVESLAEVMKAGAESSSVSPESIIELYSLAFKHTAFQASPAITTALVACHARRNDVNALEALQAETLNTTSDPDPAVVHEIISGYLQSNALSRALAFGEELKRRNGGLIGESTYCQLIRACGSAGFVEKAFALFEEMKSMGYPASRSGYNAMLFACTAVDTSNEGFKKATELLESMKNDGLTPDQGSYFALMTGAANMGDVMMALEVLEQMKAAQVEPDKKIFEAAIRACARQKSMNGPPAPVIFATQFMLGSLAVLFTAGAVTGDASIDSTKLLVGTSGFIAMMYGVRSTGKSLAQQFFNFYQGGKEYGGGMKGLTTHLMRRVSDEGSMSRALHVYQKMRENRNIGVRPDTETYLLLLNTAINKKQLGIAYVLLGNAEQEGVNVGDAELLQQLLEGLRAGKNLKHARKVFRVGVKEGIWSLSVRRDKVLEEEIVDLRLIPAWLTRTAVGTVIEDLLQRVTETEGVRAKASPTSSSVSVPRYVIFQATSATTEAVRQALEEDVKPTLPWIPDHTRTDAIVLDCDSLWRGVEIL